MTATSAVPFDIDAALATEGWREGLAWPLDVVAWGGVARAATRGLLAAGLALPAGPARAIALLALPRIALRGRTLLLAAATLAAAERAGLAMVGGPPEAAALRGDTGAGVTPEGVLPQDRGVPARWRAAARTLALNPSPRWPRALAAPDAVAVTHNTLLAAEVRRRGQSVGFVHANRLLDRARASGSPHAATDVAGIADALVAALLAHDVSGPPWRERLAALLEAFTRHVVGEAARDLAALAALPSLPRMVWSGTGGNYAARAVGLAAMARGGETVRFAHGAAFATMALAEHLAVVELGAVSRYVVETAAVAGVSVVMEARALAGPGAATVEGGGGDPGLTRTPVRRARGAGGRPRVLYVAAASFGFAVHAPPFLPDPIYLDWQLRLAGLLLALPVTLRCQPHPEGLFLGRTHPLAAVAPTHRGRFEAVVDEADVLVFDYAGSTTFWKGAMGDRRIVLIDLGTLPFAAEVRPLVAARAAVVPAHYDERGRPTVEATRLAEAVLSGGTGAGAPIRRLLIGP